MIEFIARSGPPEAVNCPAFVCDTCGRQVAEQGCLWWGYLYPNPSDGLRHTTPVYVTHKGECVSAFEAWFHCAYPDADDASWLLCDHEIDESLEHLRSNFTHRFEDDALDDGVEYHAHRVVWPVAPLPASFPQVGQYDSLVA